MRRRRTTTAVATAVLATALSLLSACGGRTPDGGNPGNPSADTTTTQTTVPTGVGG